MKIRLLTFFIIVGLFAVSVWSYRWIFPYRFDYTYFKDWYDHSQWSIPLSPRIMGDAELYQLSGYSLLKGDSPFHINPETPPLAKYAYGASILFFNNPYYASIIFYAFSLLLFWWFSHLVLRSKSLVLLAVFFYATSPLFFSQIGQVGLDLPQLCFLLIHLIFFFLCVQNEEKKSSLISWFFLVVSGIGLGAFTVTKIGFFVPIILLVDAWLLWKKKRFTQLIPLVAFTGITYVASYAPYFFQHHSFIEWLKAQKWMINFYTSAHVQFIPFMIFVTLISGFLVSWWNSTEYVQEWTLLWPAALVIFFYYLFRRHFWKDAHRTWQWQYVLFLLLGLILTNSIIPFWSRYLILLLPFLILLVVDFLGRHKRLAIVFIFISLAHFVFFLFPRPQEMVSIADQAWQSGSYPELYSFLDQSSKNTISREQFTRDLRLVDYNLETPKKEVKIIEPWDFPWENSDNASTIVTAITYDSPIGKLNNTTTLKIHRENNQWRIHWDWSAVLPHFIPNDQVQLEKTSAPDGTLRTGEDRIVLSLEKPWPFISVVPNQLAHDAEPTLHLIFQVTGIDAIQQRASIFVLGLADRKTPIGFAMHEYNTDILKNLQLQKGVIVDQVAHHEYNPDLLKPPFYEKILETEKQYPQLFASPGGKVNLVDSSGRTLTIFETTAQPGIDVTLPKKFYDFFGRDLKDQALP